MQIEFDPAKDAINIAKRGISLSLAAALLAGKPDIAIDGRFEYGEEREIATGEIGGRLFICVYTMRGSVYRIISLRKANRREIDAYYENDRD